MPEKTVIGYTLICDECGRDAMDDVCDGEYGSWNDLDELKHLAKSDHDWSNPERDLWFCEQHSTSVPKEEDNSDPTPLPSPLEGVAW